jgi:hypothetical protein
MFGYYRGNSDMLRIMSREMHKMVIEEEESNIALMVRRVRQMAGVLAAPLRKDIARRRVVVGNPVELARVFIALTHTHAVHRILAPHGAKPFDPEREADFLIRLFFDGVSLTAFKKTTLS